MSGTNLSSFIWYVADLLRGDYKQSEYGKVILPFTVLRRLDCVLEPTKGAVLELRAPVVPLDRAGWVEVPELWRCGKMYGLPVRRRRPWPRYEPVECERCTR